MNQFSKTRAWQVWIQFKMWALFPLSHLHDLLLHRSAPILTSAAIYELFMNIFTSRQHFFTNAAVIKLDLMATYFFGFLSFSQVLLAFWRTLGRWWAFNGFCGNFGWNGNGGSLTMCSSCRVASVLLVWMGSTQLRCCICAFRIFVFIVGSFYGSFCASHLNG